MYIILSTIRTGLRNQNVPLALYNYQSIDCGTPANANPQLFIDQKGVELFQFDPIPGVQEIKGGGSYMNYSNSSPWVQLQVQMLLSVCWLQNARLFLVVKSNVEIWGYFIILVLLSSKLARQGDIGNCSTLMDILNS